MVCIFILSCSPGQTSDDGDNQNGKPNDNRLLLTAILPATVPGGGSVTGVILITGNSHQLIQVSDVNLEIDISTKKGKALGVLFVGSDNRSIGALRFVTSKGDLYLLPLFNVEKGEIGFGKISFGKNGDGQDVAMPEIDPIGPGKVIDMSETEKGSLALASNILGNMIVNPDANDNGEIDFLENTIYRFAFQYHIDAGRVPAYSPENKMYPAVMFDQSLLNGFYTHCGIVREDEPDWWYKEYPIVFPDTWDAAWPRGLYTSTAVTQNSDGVGGQTHYPTDGTYTVAINDDGATPYDTFYFVESQEVVLKSALIPMPAYYVKNGMLEKVTWEWRFQNNMAGSDEDSTFIVNRLMIQVSDAQDTMLRIYNSDGAGALYSWSGTSLNGSEGEHILGRDDVPWVDCDRIDFAYFDHFGNHMVVQFARLNPGN